VPAAADLVVLGNPTNPTSVLHPADTIRAAARARPRHRRRRSVRRCGAREPESLAGARPRTFSWLRSLTKTWALAGLRCGYFLGAPELLARLNHGRAHWPLGILPLEAITATAEPRAVAWRGRGAGDRG